MKTSFALALGMLFASAALAAPPQKLNELSVAFGDAGLIFTFDELATTIFSLGTVTYGDNEDSRQVVAGYQRGLNRWASLGVTASWASADRTVYVLRKDAGRVERRLLTVMADGRAHWLRRSSVDMYSGIALGFARLSDDWPSARADDTTTGFGFHVMPVGIRVGRDLGVILETGVGWHGFLKLGLSGRW